MPYTNRTIIRSTRTYRNTPDIGGMIRKIQYGLLGTGLFILLWAFVGFLIFSRPGYEQFTGFLPLPTLKALCVLFLEHDFWYSVSASLRRVMVGISIAFLVGLPFGLFIGFYNKLRYITQGPIQFLRMISPLAWMPVALLLFKSFETAIYFLITMATVWPIILNTASGVLGVNPNWMLMARNQGASSSQLLLHIVLPSSVPYIVTSLRLALGVAWIVLVPAEYLGVTSGLGYIINDARDTMEYDRLMATLIAIGIVGYALDSAIHSIQNIFPDYQQG